MNVINIDSVAFHIGPLEVCWYGLMYLVGITIGLTLAWSYAKSKGLIESTQVTGFAWATPLVLLILDYTMLSSSLWDLTHPNRGVSWQTIAGKIIKYSKES